MNSQVTDDFLACFRRLPIEVQDQARKAYRLWRENPSHPGLRFKPIRGHAGLYSVRVSLGWRAIGVLNGDPIQNHVIGSHADYDSLIG